MKNVERTTRLPLLVALLLSISGAYAQERIPKPRPVVLQVEGLTTATRDGLIRDLASSSDLELVYACVPAGILVFGTRTSLSRSDIESRGRAMLTSRSSSDQVRRLDHDLAAAEEACAQVRNR